MKKIILSVVFTLVGLAVIGLIIILTGAYNVSAMEPDTGIIHWVLETTSDRSVDVRSADIKVPDLENPGMINAGISRYKEMCAQCHHAPGMNETDLAKGLNPDPPNLYKWGHRMNPAHLFWVTKNGIKSSPMSWIE